MSSLYSWLHWVLVALHGPSLVVMSRAPLHCDACAVLSPLARAQTLATRASAAAAHWLGRCCFWAPEHRLRHCECRLSHPAVCGIFKPVSPAIAEFSSPAPLGKSLWMFLDTDAWIQGRERERVKLGDVTVLIASGSL